MIEELLGIDENILAALVVLIGAVVAYLLFFREEPPPPQYKNAASLFTTASSASTRLSGTSGNSLPGALSKGKSKRSRRAAVDESKPRCSILFGSQTGTAEEFAHVIEQGAKSCGFEAVVDDLEEYDFADGLAQEKLVILLMATYGEGEPTDNAADFMEWLNDEERADDELSDVKYAVFGLGNTTYEHYNSIGKQVDKRMSELGATRVYELGLGDDDCSLEDDFNKWKAGLWTPVCNEFGLSDTHTQSNVLDARYRLKEHDSNVKILDRWSEIRGHTGLTKSSTGIAKTSTYDLKNPYLARIMVNRELHTPQSSRSCRHLEIDVGDALTYEAGDHIGIYAENDAEAVDALLRRLDVDGDRVISLQPIDGKGGALVGPCSVRTILTRFADIMSTPRQAVLATLAQYADDEQEREQLTVMGSDSDEGSKLYHKLKSDLCSIGEILHMFPSLRPPLAHFLELMPRLAPRYYSISSSPKKHRNSVHVTAVVTEFTTPTGRLHKGVATTWFARLAEAAATAAPVECFIRRSTFKLPRSLSKPTIMVGPGTGLAPFRGFLHELEAVRDGGDEATRDIGDAVLYFGCRSSREDFLYSDELRAFESGGLLSSLHLAFSREQGDSAPRRYVQHLMKEEERAAELWRLLHEKGAYFYVCGDAHKMAKDVHAQLVQIAKQNLKDGGATDSEAEAYIDQLAKSGRYQKDVWY